MICPARDVIDLVALDPFSDEASRKTDGQFISVLENRPRTRPRLPLYVPEGRDWQVEKRLGVAATTRGWQTILKVCQALGMESGWRRPA